MGAQFIFKSHPFEVIKDIYISGEIPRHSTYETINESYMFRSKESYIHDEIHDAFPPGKLPPIEKTTMRTSKEMEPYLKEPFSNGWRPIYSIPKMGL